MIFQRKGFCSLVLLAVCSGIGATPIALTLDAPADSQKNQSLTPTLSWKAATGATSYHLQVSSTPDFSTTVVDQSGISTTSITIGTSLTSSSITIGTPYPDGRTGVGNDQPLAYFIKPDGVTYRSWQTTQLGNDGELWEGTVDQPVKLHVGNYSWSWGSITGRDAGAWIMRAYQVDGDTMIGWIHQEGVSEQDFFMYGLAVSFNQGNAWTFCGDILKPQNASEGGGNVAGGAVIVKDGYFYAYYDEHCSSGGGTAVARARVSDVVEAARRRTIVKWYKYANGAWDIDAFTGCGASVVKAVSGGSADVHTHATFIATTGTYLIGLNDQQNGRCLIQSSIDGISWGNQYVVLDRGWMHPYGTFVGTKAAGARNDQFEQGNSFWYYWDNKGVTRPTDYNDDTWMRVKIDVAPKVYYWRVAATDGSGTGSWSAARKFTTAALITGGGPPVSTLASRIGSLEHSSIAVKVDRDNSVHVSVTRAGKPQASIAVFDVQGRQVYTSIRSPTESGSYRLEFCTKTLRCGQYLVRVVSEGLSETIPIAILR